ncbi:Cu(2+)-transporting P-type ATPase [Microbotryomycetes sp. JL221]|nr:Cu(2+)-transporting P-type ATPase [Microbotryomycetes sp. JL221]
MDDDEDMLSFGQVRPSTSDKDNSTTSSSQAVTDLSKSFDTSKLDTVTLSVQGMTCGACVASIENGLKDQHGIHSVQVALLAEKAVIEYDPILWTPDKLAEEIEDMGFEAAPMTAITSDSVTLQVYGMTCGACVASIENNLTSTRGILSAVVSLATERAVITYDPAIIRGPRDIVDLIEDTGFDAVLTSDESTAVQLKSLSRTKEIQQWKTAFQRSLMFGIPVFLLSMVFPMISFLKHIVMFQIIKGVHLGNVVCLLLTIPVQFGVGRKFYTSAYRAIKHGSATMDVLVVLGTSAAFCYSVVIMTISPFIQSNKSQNTTVQDFYPKVFFETCTMLITFVTFGRFLENVAKGQTSVALSKLMNLTPSQATIYTDVPTCTKEKRIATELVQVGDVVKIVPGDKIPADGIVRSGESQIDESMVTGEVMPVSKTIGSLVIGGTVNGQGTFDMTVTRAGKDTALSQIVQLVNQAQTSKAPIQTFADTIAGYFVPAVISLGLLTFVGWMLISHLASTSLPTVFHEQGVNKFMVCLKLCISVIVVACPCALGLATPTAVMVGTGVGATNGILLKGAGPLEASHKIDRIVFDKTGTITMGKLDVVGVKWSDRFGYDKAQIEQLQGESTVVGWQRETILLFVAAETRSEHPLARAMSQWGLRELDMDTVPVAIDVVSFESVTGLGIKCQVSGYFPTLSGSSKTNTTTIRSVAIGNSTFLNQLGMTVPTALTTFQTREQSIGRTCVFVAIDDTVSCIISLADMIKSEARQAIDALRIMGIHVSMVTGDQHATALAIASEVGIERDNVHAGVSPSGKKSIVEKMQRVGHRVAMSMSLFVDQLSFAVTQVGDGINDSPALAASDVGIALCSGTDIAMEAADIVLMRSDLLDVVASIDLSRRIFKQIRLNYIWATAYNLFAIPLAMGFFLPWNIHMHPMMAGAAMAFSSVSVVCSSLTLKWWRRPRFARHSDDPLGDKNEGSLFEITGALVDAVQRLIPNTLWQALKQRRMRRTRIYDYSPTLTESGRRPSEYGLLATSPMDEYDVEDIPLVEATHRG